MYTIGQTLLLNLGVRGKMEVKVVATGGGHTTTVQIGRWEGVEAVTKATPSVFYAERPLLKCYKDADLAKEVVG